MTTSNQSLPEGCVGLPPPADEPIPLDQVKALNDFFTWASRKHGTRSFRVYIGVDGRLEIYDANYNLRLPTAEAFAELVQQSEATFRGVLDKIKEFPPPTIIEEPPESHGPTSHDFLGVRRLPSP